MLHFYCLFSYFRLFLAVYFQYACFLKAIKQIPKDLFVIQQCKNAWFILI